MHRGKYQFEDFIRGDFTSNYTSYLVKNRTIYQPDRKLKTYLVFLNTFIFEYLEVNDRVVYSYRKGINPHNVALAHVCSRAFLQTDILDFFGSITRSLIKSTILSQHHRTPVSDLHSHIDRILDLITINGVLPVGFPTSPPVSNVCLADPP